MAEVHSGDVIPASTSALTWSSAGPTRPEECQAIFPRLVTTIARRGDRPKHRRVSTSPLHRGQPSQPDRLGRRGYPLIVGLQREAWQVAPFVHDLSRHSQSSPVSQGAKSPWRRRETTGLAGTPDKQKGVSVMLAASSPCWQIVVVTRPPHAGDDFQHINE